MAAQKHPRLVIREKVAALLRHKTDAQDRVFEMRVDPWRMRELPGISVYTLKEESDVSDLDADSDRTLAVDVKAIVAVREDDNAGEALDPIALQVETAMLSDPRLGGLALSTTLAGTVVEFFEEGRKLMAAVTLQFTVEYETSAP